MGAMALVLSRSGPPDPETVDRMLAAAPHRGERRETETLGRVTVGVCNDPAWTTATLARDGGRVAVFQGALDNAPDLRTALRREGSRGPAEPTPAATVLAAFRAWGEDEGARRLRGSFAGAVTDGREVLCFRDQFGARPLFHHDAREGFFAATEVKQVLQGAPIRPEPDMDHLHGIVYGGIEESTAFRGVRRVPKRSLLRAGPEPGLEVGRYWEPDALVETASLGVEEAVEGVRERLEQAVRRVLTGGDVILLSGGLDSPALAAFAATDGVRARPARALTAVYPDHPSVDERDWTQAAADHVGMRLHRFAPDTGNLDDVERWVRVLDGPVDTLSIPQMEEAFRTARSMGARTVLTGEIAEILFDNRAYLLDHYLSHGRLRPLLRYLSRLHDRGWSLRKIVANLLYVVTPTRLMALYLERSSGRLPGVPSWVDVRRLRDARPDVPPWKLPARRRWPAMQTSMIRGGGTHFEASEICGAVCGVDARRPFADVDLWEFVLGLPAEVKFPDRASKPLLRRAMRGRLPDRLIDRKDDTVFNEYVLDRADYSKLRRLLVESPPYLEGIDYGRIRERLEEGEMDIVGLQWARDVARVHAFLEQF